MDRREFLGKVCLTGTVLALGEIVIETTGLRTLRASPRRKMEGGHEIPLLLEDTPDLKPVGGAYHLEIELLDKSIIVAHVSKTLFVAVNIKCTHKGCDVTYQPDRHLFNCPCHGSDFDINGTVVKGPAKKPLQRYKTILKEDELTIYIPAENENPEFPLSPIDSTWSNAPATIDSTTFK